MTDSKPTDVRIVGVTLHTIPVETRTPLKFGTEVTTEVTCARVRIAVENGNGDKAEGWGETPLSVQWVWPSPVAYSERHGALLEFCSLLVQEYADFDVAGHPMEIGHAFLETVLPGLTENFNRTTRAGKEPLPYLAALVCCSAFDIALHDAYGIVNEVPIYDTYNAQYMNADLTRYLKPAEGTDIDFAGTYPENYFVEDPAKTLPAWHLVGGLDPVDKSDLTGDEPDDGYPVLLSDWIDTDGLNCLKIKLRGNDREWDLDRLLRVGRMAIEKDVEWLTTDFNCTVEQPEYVCSILDDVMESDPAIYGKILYVEQPFPYDLEKHRIDVRSVSARKPLFMDESAHDWKMVRLGRELGWTGVALKTCKTQTGALLSLCWAKAHGMTLMVQDLTNPMLAQVSHVRLAQHAGTICGVETNAMQFYPKISAPEAIVHPGLYRRQEGVLDLSTLGGPGFGYRVGEIEREVPAV